MLIIFGNEIFQITSSSKMLDWSQEEGIEFSMIFTTLIFMILFNKFNNITYEEEKF